MKNGRLIDFFRYNSDCFACSHADMHGIDLEIIMHKLQVDPLPGAPQKLTGRMAVLSRFISRHSNKSHPFFGTL